jgi:phosphatidate cytidylyltransferase
MLKVRVATALALLALIVPAMTWLSVVGWALFVLVFVAAGAWEWGRLCGFKGAAAFVYGAVVASAALVLLATSAADDPGMFLYPNVVAVAIWTAIALMWSIRGPLAPRGAGLAVIGAVLLVGCWWAVVQARASGVLFMFLLMGLVWVADIAAYFAGRRFGRHKLAPSVSPGKTWEGVAGACAGGAALAAACAFATTANGSAHDSWFAWLGGYAARGGVAGMVTALVVVWVVVGASILGDLFESLLKRRAGVKDSSALLPGHGGVLDRIDALIPAMPLAMLIHGMIRVAS